MELSKEQKYIIDKLGIKINDFDKDKKEVQFIILDNNKVIYKTYMCNSTHGIKRFFCEIYIKKLGGKVFMKELDNNLNVIF